MNQILYYRDDLDDAIDKLEPTVSPRVDYAARRDSAYAIVIGQYNKERIADPDDFIIDDNFDAPLSTATQIINTSVYDLFRADIPVTQFGIHGNTILVQQSTGVFLQAPREEIADLVLTGGSATVLAFATHGSKIDLFSKDGTFTAPGNLCYFFYRVLDNTLPDDHTTPLDIRAEDFMDIAQRVSELMLSN